MRLDPKMNAKLLAGLLDEPRNIRFEQTQREPVKFEVGQVVRVVEHDDGTVVGDAARVVARVSYDMIWCCDPRNLLYMDRYSTVSDCHRFAILSPAPRVGDKWTNGESVARVSADPDTAQLCLVTEGDPFVGDVVAVARRLWEGGYRVARARSASESSADVLASMARAGVKKWSDRGVLTFEQMFASDPYAQALVEDAHAGDLYSRVLAQADAEIKKAILGTSDREWQQQTAYQREVDGVCRDELPRAGDVYQNAMHTVRMRVCADGDLRTQIIASSLPEPQREVARHPAAEMAEYLRELGYRRVETNPFAAAITRWTGERLRVEAAQWGIAPFAGETDTQLRERMEAMLRRPWKALYPSDAVERVRDCIIESAARSIQRVRDSTRVDRTTGDDLRKFAELHGAPELRAGMVVRREDRGGGALTGVIKAVNERGVRVRWIGIEYDALHASDHARRCIESGRWRIADPDVRPFAALADAVAAIFTTPDIATSRRYIDMAIASVRGEPFAHAVAAVLVAASDAPLSAHTIAGIVRGARSHERRRSEVAPGRRELTVAQLLMCSAVAFCDADGCWDARLSRIYERARAAG